MALSEDARRIVDAARAAYEPSQEDRARIAAALPLRITAAAGASSASSSATTAAAGGLAGKSVVLGLAALVVLGGASAGFWWWSRSGAATRATARIEAPPPARIVDPVETDQPAAPSAGAAPAEEAVKPAARMSRSRPATAPRSAAARPAGPEPGPNVAGELALLDEAQRALASGHPDRALQLLERHERDFPRGSFVEERTAARIIALCALGRVASARAEAATFIRQFPTSPLGERVRAACGTELVPAALNQ